MIYIYKLEYSDIEEIYIGSTKNPEQRLRAHKNNGTCIADWYAVKRKIKMTLIDEVDEIDRLYWERFYINLCKSMGIKIKNKGVIKNAYPDGLTKGKLFQNKIGK